MAGASVTKKLKTEVRSSIRAGFRARGWVPQKGDATTQVAPESLVHPPLQLSWDLTVDSYKFGGALLTGNGYLRSPAVTQIILAFDPASRPETFEYFPGDVYAALRLMVDSVSAGGLIDPDRRDYHKWVVDEESAVEPVVAAFLAMIDSALGVWISERATPALLLERHRRSGVNDPMRRDPAGVRTRATLALLEDDPDTARFILGAYREHADSDGERIALFERELADRFPTYGSLQLGSTR